MNPESFQIVRMRTDLLAPRYDATLDMMTTDIRFGEVRFGATTQAFWLPKEVVVDILWSGQRYRNIHRYSAYRVFLVETREKIEPPKIKKSPQGLPPRIPW